MDKGQAIIHFKSSGCGGDVIYQLSGIKAACEKADAKAVIHLVEGVRAHYYDGNTHHGDGYMLNRQMIMMLTPLLKAQPYVHEVCFWKGAPEGTPIVDFDLVRQMDTGMPQHDIKKWFLQLYPYMACDLSQRWLNIWDLDVPYLDEYHEKYKNKIVCSFSSRYRNPFVRYDFLNKVDNDIIFLGLQHEYQEFIKQVPKALYIEVQDFLEMAKIIDSCKLFLGNQSLGLALAEALKAPRLIEMFLNAPNCIPYGENAYEALNQKTLEYFFKELMK